MARNCGDEIAKLFNEGKEKGDQLSRALIEQIVSRMDEEKRLAFTHGVLNPESQFREKAFEIIQRYRRDMSVERAKAVDSLHKRTVFEAKTGNYNSVAEGMSAGIVGSNKIAEDSRLSVDAQQKAIRGKLLSVLFKDFMDPKNKGLLDIARDGAIDRDVRLGIQELNKKDGDIGRLEISPEAKKLAGIYQKSQKAFLGTMNAAGAYIRELEGYAGRITHDADKIVSTGKDAWIERIMPLLDQDKTFRSGLIAEKPEEMLGRIWEDIREGRSSRTMMAESKDKFIKLIDMPANFAKRAERSRSLHFEDASAEHSYLQQFGQSRWRLNVDGGIPKWENSPITLLEEHAQLMSKGGRDAGLMRTFGANPGASFERLLGDLNLTDPKYKYIRNQFAEVSGETLRPGTTMMAKVGQFVRGGVGMAKLGAAFLRSFPDMESRAFQLKSSTGMSFLEAHHATYSSFLEKLVSPSERREASYLTGVAMDAYIGHTFSSFSSMDSAPGAMSKAMHYFHKLTLLGPWTEINKQAHASVLSAGLGMRAELEHGALDAATQKNFGRFGIKPPDWDMMRAAAAKAEDGRMHIGHEAVSSIPDDVAEKIARDHGIITDDTKNPKRALANFKEDSAVKLATYYSDQASTAMLESGARERAFWLRGTHADTVEGQVFRYIAQFKHYPTAIITKTMENTAFANDAHSWTEAMSQGKGNKMNIAALAGSLTAMGYISSVASSLSKGQEPPDPKSMDAWKEAFKTGGAMGLLGDAVLGEYDSRYGRGFASSMLGPVFGQADDMADFYTKYKAYMTDTTGKAKPPAAAAARIALNNVPGNNLFYARGAMNYLFLYNMQESLNPGFINRMETRAQKKGQPMMVHPLGR